MVAVVPLGGPIGVCHHCDPGRHAWWQARPSHYLLVHQCRAVGSAVWCSAGGEGGRGWGAGCGVSPARPKHLNDEVLDLALEPLRVLYPQAHIPPAGTSNRLGRLGLQRRVEAAHPGGLVEQWLTLRNPSTAEGHWYLHQLLFQPRAAPEHRRQNPYHTHPERRGAQNYPQPVPPALPPGQGPEALQRGPPLDTATTVH